MSLINIINLTFAYPGSSENIFENVSFQIDSSWKLGFIGRNGRGKTTFLNLLCEKYEYKGNISANVDFDLFPYEIEDENTLTEEIIESVCFGCQPWQINRELNLLGVSPDVIYRPFCTLSKGEQAKVMLASLFVKENNFLLIDEPTNHLDISGRQALGNYLKTKSGFILVSHDRNLLDECCDHILSVNRNDIKIEKGNYSSWKMNKDRQDSFETAENEKLKKEIKRLSDTSAKKAQWSVKAEKSKFATDNSGSKIDRGYVGHKAAKTMKRSKVLEQRQQKTIDEKSKLMKNIESSQKLKIEQLNYPNDTLVSLNNVSIYYDGEPVCSDISFCICKGDRISLMGKNGSGKSSIIKLICTGGIDYTGEMKKRNSLKISYVSQDTSHLCSTLSEYAKENDIDETLFTAILSKLNLERSYFDRNIENFSDGQKKKVLIARSLCEKSHLLVWDEPLNYIDIVSRVQIEDLLLEYKPTILFVEHDKTFCDNIANKTVKL